MWRAIASNALTLFIILLVALAGLLAWGREQFVGRGPLAEAVCFRVERGASLSAVSRALEEEGAISDARIFRIGAEYSGKADGLKFGSYLIAARSSMVEVLEALTAGGQSTCG
ncbi:MAG: endolytic transglycosylase MltG, partial [Pseudomonadota bacterium]